MKRHLNFRSLMIGGALAVAAGPLAGSSAVARSANAETVVEGVNLRKTRTGLNLTLKTSGDTPQILTARAGETLQADIAHAQLQIPEGESFTQKNPAPGIESVTLKDLGGDRVRLTVEGDDKAPVSKIEKTSKVGVKLSFDTRANAKAVPSAVPEMIETVPGEAASEETEAVAPTVVEPFKLAQQSEDTPDILVPNPEVIIDGAPVTSPSINEAPPFLPRAVAPPVGDLSVSEIDTSLDEIDLGTAERVPRLVLRDASVREVLSLLARAAGLNLAFSNNGDGTESTTASDDVRISLDIENEPVQNVFNYVLQLSGLEANKIGRTIFVGTALPDSARNIVSRTIRLNQVSAEAAASFLSAQGAVTQVPTEQVRVEIIGGNDGIPARTIETREPSILALQAEEGSGALLLNGLSIVADPRLNAITLLGTPRKVAIATDFITQLDLRRRQVAVNLRVIDVDLDADSQFGASFSYGLGNSGFSSQSGLGIFSFGGTGSAVSFAREFIARLQATITNGQSKIITDPTLVVQEGQTAEVNLVQEIITEVDTEINLETGLTTVDVTKGQAGLQLDVNVERIDDNGFVTLSVAPSISAPGATETVSGIPITLLAERSLSSGSVRVRDGQTLVLSGIIQDTDRVTTSKVPILGDIPILGALFRSSSRADERRELIVLLTPQILDDSDSSVYGYSYQPGEDVQQLLEDRQVE